jgi:hypothetical protein
MFTSLTSANITKIVAVYNLKCDQDTYCKESQWIQLHKTVRIWPKGYDPALVEPGETCDTRTTASLKILAGKIMQRTVSYCSMRSTGVVLKPNRASRIIDYLLYFL